MKTTIAVAFFLLAISFVSSAHADTFGSGSNIFEIEFVNIGNPGNPNDDIVRRTFGSVGYDFRMAKYEISESMMDVANSNGDLGISYFPFRQGGWGPNKPVSGLSWLDAAGFVNWLNSSTGHTPAYKFSPNGTFQLWQLEDAGYDSENPYRNRLSRYFLPSLDEWYKAAFYDPDVEDYYAYATGSDTVPSPVSEGTDSGTAVYLLGNAEGPADIAQAGGLSPYGTMAQNGNIHELLETEFDLINDSALPSVQMMVRGGMYVSQDYVLTSTWQSFVSRDFKSNSSGFRVASIIPEPTTYTLALVALCLAMSRRQTNLSSASLDTGSITTNPSYRSLESL